jgi:hypothetical protein
LFVSGRCGSSSGRRITSQSVNGGRNPRESGDEVTAAERTPHRCPADDSGIQGVEGTAAEGALEGARRATGDAPSAARRRGGGGKASGGDDKRDRDAVERRRQRNRHDTGPNRQVHTDVAPHTVPGTGAGRVSPSRESLSTSRWRDLGRRWRPRADSSSVRAAGHRW